MKLRRSAALVGAAVLFGTVACSNNGPGSSGSGGGSGDGTIKLLVISQLQATAFSFPEIADGAQAAAQSINATGGVNGHKIQVDTCNDQGDPNVAGTCGRKAAQEGYTAVINPVSLYAASYVPLLEAANIPAIGGTPLTQPDFTSKISFPISGGNPLDYGGAGMIAGKSGCKSTVLLRDTAAATEETTKAMTAGAAAGGAPVQQVIKQVGTSTDFSAPVSQAASSGADCLLVAEQPAAVAKVVGALRQSSRPDMPVYTPVAAFPDALAKSLGAAANGVHVSGSVPIPDEKITPAFLADMAKYSPNGTKSDQSLLAWSGVQVVKQVAAKANAYDAASLLKAMQSASDVSVEGFPQKFDFTKQRGGSYPRVFATSNYSWEYRDGAYNPQFGGQAIDVSAVLG
ncbi:ABC-type branched-subunit amino acid transport system substrate-binding protein [Amycolatopsis bartoniae]|uniref:Leucine-binding protein domain-containing protein n=1 Tax=Amycolatopsis bartoniae TaxID=941986 RepID=A0A8H9INP6_9PSEU|nr:ABC transporter substrate-binding protein [Amycolatopsis bartoniae]MBB2939669.1 ABC-type branched-subunit amino acid transport system substrate-binding protein [Amycolatopsis bartoniae]TVT06226.1 ABC transporter substrate-binding protein [Amycolatopsis bartoniae]GHF36640.1 hypothetical protein GCM10017566_07180 [Amycolatopsis bartoniae]